jgi:recombination protein RecT
MNNQISSKQYFNNDNVKAKFQELLGKRAPAFMTSVLQIVNNNNLLVNADPASVFNAAATAATLDLPINNNLGFAYIIPYNVKQKEGGYKTLAQFQLGYKGFIQLAQRSGQFKTISATAIYEGQITKNNPLTGYEFDFEIQPIGNPVGYAGYFKLINGFEATLYMTKKELEQHGRKYSKKFAGGVWETEFDAMAKKTVIKLLLSRYAPLSIEMQTAITTDQSVVNDFETSDVTYIDNIKEEPEDKELERIKLLIENSKSHDELFEYELAVNMYANEEVSILFNNKSAEFNGHK